MLNERHFRMWKRLASVSRMVSARQRATTACPLQRSGTPIPENVLELKETCYERMQTFDGKCVRLHDAERMKLCSRESRSRIFNLHLARSLFTSASSHAVIHTSPERNSTDNSKRNIDLKTKTARKPAAKNPAITSRRTTDQKVNMNNYYVIRN